jgi:hypothetical protein
LKSILESFHMNWNILRRAAFALGFLALAGCQATNNAISAAAPAEFDGGVIKVSYPTRGNQDIVIYINADGSVAEVQGGARAVRNLALTGDLLTFETEAATDWGYMPMSFVLAEVGEGYAGEYFIGGTCAKNCTRDGVAVWLSGRDKVLPPSG